MVDYKEDTQVNFQEDRNVLYDTVMVDTLFYAFVKVRETTSQGINFNVCKCF